MLRRLGLIFAAVAASLAFAASAQAAPTPPSLNPIPYWVCDSTLPISWTKSTPDLFGTIVGYRVDIGDLTTGTASAKFTSALGTTLTGLVNGHHYVVRVRALQKRFGVYSTRLLRRHVQAPLPADPGRDHQASTSPTTRGPSASVCGRLEYVHFDDPVIHARLEDAALPSGALRGPRARRQDGISSSAASHRQPPAPGGDQLVHLLRAV